MIPDHPHRLSLVPDVCLPLQDQCIFVLCALTNHMPYIAFEVLQLGFGCGPCLRHESPLKKQHGASVPIAPCVMIELPAVASSNEACGGVNDGWTSPEHVRFIAPWMAAALAAGVHVILTLNALLQPGRRPKRLCTYGHKRACPPHGFPLDEGAVMLA